MAGKKTFLLGACAALALSFAIGAAKADGVKIGFLTDMSGAASTMSGESSAEIIRMAIDDFGGTALGKPVVLVVADQLN